MHTFEMHKHIYMQKSKELICNAKDLSKQNNIYSSQMILYLLTTGPVEGKINFFKEQSCPLGRPKIKNITGTGK